MSKVLSFLLFFLFTASVLAQENGFIRGTITDGDFGGPMIGATVTVDGMPGVGASTDFDGNYSLPLAPGTYDISISFISFSFIVVF